jgi:hypothetical protein
LVENPSVMQRMLKMLKTMHVALLGCVHDARGGRLYPEPERADGKPESRSSTLGLRLMSTPPFTNRRTA